ncbi:FkbM family methyltransferase [Alphaproteobacteria bacterium LSUCC0684]
MAFIERFRDNYVSLDLIRVGGKGDGGYLIPDVRNDISHCFSPGVSDTANFEDELSKTNRIKSFMADASVDNSPLSNDDFNFIKKYLGNRSNGDFITLKDWMNDSLNGDENGLLLQMDIEGGEYDVLIYESAETLSRFSVMVIEFHSWQLIFQHHFLKMISSIFEKIFENFVICHVHPNNCCGIAEYEKIEVPRVLEITFIRKDLIDKFISSKKINLPHTLDQKNVKQNADIFMPVIWWKKD